MKRDDVLDHVQSSGNTCAMTTIVDPLNDLDSGSLFAVRSHRFPVVTSH
jgi:hypothetical protein